MNYSKNNYIHLNKEDINNFFEIKENKLYLKDSRAKPVNISLPFKIDENIAKIAGMLFDGSLDKNHYSIMFSQKKDKNKVKEFSNIIKNFFNINPCFSTTHNTPMVTFSSKTLATFFNKCLDLPKSDERGKVPYWIWISPRSVIIEYLRYAFAMEGSISHYLKGSEIRFHSVDLYFLKDLKKLLKNKFDINSQIIKYYIRDYGWKYFLAIYNRDGVIKFTEIGFALKSHQARLKELISSYKNKAWEITLVAILKLSKNKFTLTNINKILFPHLCERSVHNRLVSLVKMKYLQKEKIGYSLTNKGYKIALSLKNKVKFTKLRTYPKENEEKVIKFLKTKSKSYRNEISRELKINVKTMGDVLKRLINKNKIQYTGTDRFQKKFYTINSKLL